MICITIAAPDYNSLKRKLFEAINFADILEIRVDFLEKLDFSELKEIISKVSIPIILTLRTVHHGGKFAGSSSQYVQHLFKLDSLKPDYLDVEHGIPKNVVEMLCAAKFIICSHHNSRCTNDYLELILSDMRKIKVDYYKIVTEAACATDALNMLDFASEQQDDVIALCTGDYGHITRVLSPVVCNPFVFASLNDNEKTASGQLSVEDLADVYNYYSLSRESKVFGLVGNPVESSDGHLFHNSFLEKVGAVYLKFNLNIEDVDEFLSLAKKFRFKGFSVTMPLKEKIIWHLDSLSEDVRAIGAVNTIVLRGSKLIGFNTDGIGALNALEKHALVKGKKVLILGAGGTAKAVAFESIKREAEVVVVNRTKARAKLLAENFGCSAVSTVPKKYDILINCTSVGMNSDKMPLAEDKIVSGAIVMDVVSSPEETALLKAAKEKGCKTVSGREMFLEQARLQQSLWEVSKSKCVGR